VLKVRFVVPLTCGYSKNLIRTESHALVVPLRAFGREAKVSLDSDRDVPGQPVILKLAEIGALTLQQALTLPQIALELANALDQEGEH
jgi:hypothetical protein